MSTLSQEIRDAERKAIREHPAWPAWRTSRNLPSRGLTKAEVEEFLEYVDAFYGAQQLRQTIAIRQRAVKKRWAAPRRVPECKFRELIDALGGCPAAAKVIEGYGYEVPPVATIRGWHTRNSIPTRWAPILVGHAMRHGLMRSPADLIKKSVRP